ncbi:MAG: hypothetical protein GF409_06525 [Candidatus Omnitrophica bacterium]|nr:hypothetical protein [Candidatus Omnitrophota bacterium]
MGVREVDNFAEKRKYPRVSTHIPVRYRKLGEPEGQMRTNTITKNISEGGIRFGAPEFISRACRLVLELDIPMINKPVKAISKVAWIRKDGERADYEVGNQFLEISRKDKELVSEYVSSLNLYNDNDAQY